MLVQALHSTSNAEDTKILKNKYAELMFPSLVHESPAIVCLGDSF
jgi:hypothetical protein